MEKYKTPVFLDKVATLTGIRDIDIFEFSFLKTLAETLSVTDILLYKFDDTDKPFRLIKYSSTVEIVFDEMRVDETREIYVDDIEIPILLSEAIDWIKSTGEVYKTKLQDKIHTIYPISGPEHIIGYLSVTLTHELSESENLAITSLLNIAENFHSLLEENQKDKLTGLLNRKTFDENISKIQNLLSNDPKVDNHTGIERRHKAFSDEYWLSIVDIDFFKKINDSFGHIYGDEVLLLLSQIMKKTFRPTDLLFRVGGEEFIVICKVLNQDAAKNTFERFRSVVESFSFPQVGKVTISLGGTKLDDRYVISSELVGRADKALYHAKANGRNKIFFYEDLVAEGIIEEISNNNDVEFF